MPLAADSAGCYCFPAGTGVVTPRGRRAISSLHVGDTVLAENPHMHTLDAEPVQAVIADGVKLLMAVDLADGSAITATTNHPFWVDSGAAFAGPGWLPAGQLRVGDHLRTASGRDVVVTGLRQGVGHATVYTLTIAHDHTFFVGSAQILVHNADGTCALVYNHRVKAGQVTHTDDLIQQIRGQVMVDPFVKTRFWREIVNR